VYVIVPRRATSASANVFLGSFSDREPPLEQLELHVARISSDGEERAQRVVIPVSRWKTLSGGDAPPIHCANVALSDLQENGRFVLRLVDRRGKRLAEGSVETLPAVLPGGGAGQSRPFTLWASSCFHWKSADANLQSLVEQLLADPRYRPHLNVFLGDQVYLDYPQWKRFLLWGEADLKGSFNESYARTWTLPAFQRLLSSAASVFLADDHEFWNNHPNPPLSAWSWIRSGRFWQVWRRLALERFEAIQGRQACRPIELRAAHGSPDPALALFFADTSVDRDVAGHFMSEANMAALTQWLTNLKCPGVLALGQPLHTDRGSRWTMKLPGFAQFHEALVPALEKAPHDVVVLAGDAHFGRIASWRKPSGPRVIEVISSPLALVTELAGGTAVVGPRGFGSPTPAAEERPMAARARDVEYVKMVPHHALPRSKAVSEEHGLTLSFAKTDAGDVRLEVRAWFPRANASARPWSWSTRLA
jgi:hypothetical protein